MVLRRDVSVGDREIGGENGARNELSKESARRMHGNARVRFCVFKEYT